MRGKILLEGFDEKSPEAEAVGVCQFPQRSGKVDCGLIIPAELRGAVSDALFFPCPRVNGKKWRLGSVPLPRAVCVSPALCGSGLASETSVLFCSVRRRCEVFVAAR